SYLAPTFANRGLTTKIFAPEDNNWDQADSDSATILQNAAARARVDIVAGHVYPGGNYSRPMNTALAYGKPVWQTESSAIYDPWTINGALAWPHIINTQLSQAQVSAWVWWTLAHHQNPERLLSFENAADDPADGQTVYASKGFWVLGQFSKFIRP